VRKPVAWHKTLLDLFRDELADDAAGMVVGPRATEPQGVSFLARHCIARSRPLRRPRLRERTRELHREMRTHLTNLARRWHGAGHLAPDAGRSPVGAGLRGLAGVPEPARCRRPDEGLRQI